MAAIDYDDADVNYDAFTDMNKGYQSMMCNTVEKGNFNLEDTTYTAMNIDINLTAPISIPTHLEEDIMEQISSCTASDTPDQLKGQALSTNYYADAKKTSE